jgi:ferredoxin
LPSPITGDVFMSKYKIEINHDDCIGCAACTAISHNWEMKDINGEEKAKPKKQEFDDEDLETNKEVAESCPVEAIKIIDKKTGKKVA